MIYLLTDYIQICAETPHEEIQRVSTPCVLVRVTKSTQVLHLIVTVDELYRTDRSERVYNER